MTHHFGFSQDGCKTCDCDARGSQDATCNQLTGQCTCITDKVEGRRCDRCMENTQSRNGNVGQCEPCDQCYNLVQQAANNHRDDLKELAKLLQNIAENPQPVGENFESHLKHLELKIRTILENSLKFDEGAAGEDLKDTLENLSVKLGETRRRITEIEKYLVEGVNLHQEASEITGEAVDTIHDVRDSLMEVKLKLIGDCKKALAQAQERSRRFGEGSEKMTDIASKARRLSEKQELDAAEIEEMAGEAFSLASKANKLAVEGLAEQVKTTGQIQTVMNIVKDLGERIATVENLSFEALGNSKEIYNEALSIYRKIYNLESPQIETRYLTEKSLSLSRDADRLKTDADKILRENQDLLSQIKSNREELQTLLNRALSQQMEVEDRLNDMIEHRKKGKEAIALADSILKKARETLETLKDFENRVANNRDAARAALQKSNEIEETISQAIDKTFKASEFLRDTDKDSHMAYSLAVESKNLALKTSERAKLVTLETSQTRESTQNILRLGKNDEKKVISFYQLIDEKKVIAASDAKMASESLKEANQAQKSADAAELKVRQAKKELDAILDIIATVEEPEPGILDDLERRLDEAERKYQEAGIEARLFELYSERKRQNEALLEFRQEMLIMTNEFSSLRDITESLPDQCWNKIRLEP